MYNTGASTDDWDGNMYNTKQAPGSIMNVYSNPSDATPYAYADDTKSSAYAESSFVANQYADATSLGHYASPSSSNNSKYGTVDSLSGVPFLGAHEQPVPIGQGSDSSKNGYASPNRKNAADYDQPNFFM